MTTNTLTWLANQEAARHNLATERQARDSLNEDIRHNVMSENENVRHNVATEQAKTVELTEAGRHNKAVETESVRHNVATENVSNNELDVKRRDVAVKEALLPFQQVKMAAETTKLGMDTANTFVKSIPLIGALVG